MSTQSWSPALMQPLPGLLCIPTHPCLRAIYAVCRISGDGKAALFVYNYQGWSTQYLGRMISEGTTLAADWVAEWNLGTMDQFAPCNVRGCRWQA